MKRYLTFFFLLVTSLALCAYPEGAINNIDGSVLGWDNASQTWRPIAVDGNGGLSTGDNEAVASISIDTSNIESHLKADTGSSVIKTVGEMLVPIFKMFDGNETSIFGLMCNDVSEIFQQLVDSSPTGTTISAKLKNIENKTDAILDSITPKYFRTLRYNNVSSNTVTVFPIISPTDVDDHGTVRTFIELRAIDPNAEFYIGFDGNVSDSTGRPVKGRILLNMGDSMNLYVYHTNASSIQIQQTEGWR